MNIPLKLVSLLALTAIVVASILYFSGVFEHNTAKWIALLATILWFIVTPLWMGRAHRKRVPTTQEAAE